MWPILAWIHAASSAGERVERRTLVVPNPTNQFRTDSVLDLVIEGAFVDHPSWSLREAQVLDRVPPQEILSFATEGLVEITALAPPTPRRLSMNTPLMLDFGPVSDPRGKFVDVAFDVDVAGPVRLRWWTTHHPEDEYYVAMLSLLGPAGTVEPLAMDVEEGGWTGEWWLPKGRWVARIRPPTVCLWRPCDESDLDVSWGVGIVRLPPQHPHEPSSPTAEPTPDEPVTDATVLGLGRRTFALASSVVPVEVKLRTVPGQDVVVSWSPPEVAVEWSTDGTTKGSGPPPIVFESAPFSEITLEVVPGKIAQNITLEARSLPRPTPAARVATSVWANAWLQPAVDPRGSFVDVAFEVVEPGLYNLVVMNQAAPPPSLSLSGPGWRPTGLPPGLQGPFSGQMVLIEVPGTYVARATGEPQGPKRQIQMALIPDDD
jgi:hypothetical protein